MPPAPVPAKRTAVLSPWPHAVLLVRRYHLDAELSEFRIETIAVVRTVADQPFGQRLHESRIERVDYELRFMALTARNPDGERKAMAVCHCHDLGRLAASSDPNLKTPLLAPAWVPSMNASVRSSFPRSRRSSASAASTRSSTPSRSHFWNRSWHVCGGGYRLGRSAQGAPVRRIHRMPFMTSLGSRQGRPPFAVVPCRSGSGMLLRIAAHCASVRSITKEQTLFAPDGKSLLEDGAISITCRLLRLSDAF